jgi:hypothetical protein
VAAGPDNKRTLSGARLSEVVGVLRQTRDAWAARGLLRRRDRYELFDLVELAVLSELSKFLRKHDVPVAWAQVRPALKTVVATPSLALVWDSQERRATLTFEDNEIMALVRHGRPIQVIDLGARIASARGAFDRETRRDGASTVARQRPRAQPRAKREL